MHSVAFRHRPGPPERAAVQLYAPAGATACFATVWPRCSGRLNLGPARRHSGLAKDVDGIFWRKRSTHTAGPASTASRLAKKRFPIIGATCCGAHADGGQPFHLGYFGHLGRAAVVQPAGCAAARLCSACSTAQAGFHSQSSGKSRHPAAAPVPSLKRSVCVSVPRSTCNSAAYPPFAHRSASTGSGLVSNSKRP